MDAAVRRWQRVDVLVNNAGGFPKIKATEDIDDEEWEQILRFNLSSTFLCSKAVLPIMKRQRSGRIINMSSVVARGAPVTVTSHYAASKAAILGFTRHLAREVGASAMQQAMHHAQAVSAAGGQHVLGAGHVGAVVVGVVAADARLGGDVEENVATRGRLRRMGVGSS